MAFCVPSSTSELINGLLALKRASVSETAGEAQKIMGFVANRGIGSAENVIVEVISAFRSLLAPVGGKEVDEKGAFAILCVCDQFLNPRMAAKLIESSSGKAVLSDTVSAVAQQISNIIPEVVFELKIYSDSPAGQKAKAAIERVFRQLTRLMLGWRATSYSSAGPSGATEPVDVESFRKALTQAISGKKIEIPKKSISVVSEKEEPKAPSEEKEVVTSTLSSAEVVVRLGVLQRAADTMELLQSKTDTTSILPNAAELLETLRTSLVDITPQSVCAEEATSDFEKIAEITQAALDEIQSYSFAEAQKSLLGILGEKRPRLKEEIKKMQVVSAQLEETPLESIYFDPTLVQSDALHNTTLSHRCPANDTLVHFAGTLPSVRPQRYELFDFARYQERACRKLSGVSRRQDSNSSLTASEIDLGPLEFYDKIITTLTSDSRGSACPDVERRIRTSLELFNGTPSRPSKCGFPPPFQVPLAMKKHREQQLAGSNDREAIELGETIDEIWSSGLRKTPFSFRGIVAYPLRNGIYNGISDSSLSGAAKPRLYAVVQALKENNSSGSNLKISRNWWLSEDEWVNEVDYAYTQQFFYSE